jgi:hypothetical protein
MICRVLLITTLASALPVYAGQCNVVNGQAFGDCSSVHLGHGPITVDNARTETGIIEGAHIRRGGSLTLSGVSNGDVVVESGGFLVTTGVVNGTITNNGGIIMLQGTATALQVNGGTSTIFGIVQSVSGSGNVRYEKNAVVAGVPVQ